MSKPYDLGFLGGGQLARMSIQAAQRMGLRCLSLDPGDKTPASEIAPAQVGALDDPDKIAELFRACAKVTLENEFIPAESIRQGLALAGEPESTLMPGLDTLGTIQDKLLQREAYRRAGAPSPIALPLEGDGAEAVRTLGFPMVLKARFGGYDGKGTRYARTPEELEEHRPLWGQGGWMAEGFVDFRRELAVMVYRRGDHVGCFPTVETIQTNHVCDLVFPAGVDASAAAIEAVEAVGGEGLFGVELFETREGAFLINEIAPRPHNTGHSTLDGCSLSQFDMHIRLTLGLPLPAPQSVRPVVMANLLGQPGAGDFRKGLRAVCDPDARLHWYGKAESRPGRKMGHLNLIGEEGAPIERLVERARLAREAFYGGWTA